VLTLPGEEGKIASEHAVFVSTEPLLLGIVSKPPAGELRRRGVILLNSGGDYHIGPRRMNVDLARRWVTHGFVVLRMDLSGLGDSAARSGQPENMVFPRQAVDDVRAAVEFLRSHHDVREVTLAGLCSGAYHSYRAGVAELPVDRLLMVNPLNFFWEEGMKVDGLQLADVVVNPGMHGRRMLSWNSWKRLLTFQVDLGRLLVIYWQRALLPIERAARRLARKAHIPLPRDVGRALDKMVARGIRPVFVFARGDAGLALLGIQSGLSEQQLSERYRVIIIDGADHNFTRTHARAALEEVLSEELFAPPLPNRKAEHGRRSAGTAAQRLAEP
jgi:hypothetical protein